MNVQDIRLDINKSPSIGKWVTIGQGDKAGTTIRATVYDNGAAAELAGMTARFEMRMPNATYFEDADCTVSGNVITYVVDESHAALYAGGGNEAYFALYDGDTAIYSTERFHVRVLRAATQGADPAHSYSDDIVSATTAARQAASDAREAMEEIGTAVEDAAQAAESAAQAVEGAAQAVEDAQTAIADANSAKQAATSAANAANTAKANADAATIRANEATNSANDAAEDARQAAEEARGAISPELTLYLTYEQVGDTEYLTLVDASE